jgi:spermidine synthase
MKTLHRVRGLVHDLTVTRDGTTLTLWSESGIRHTVLDLGAPYLPGLEYARDTLLALAFNPASRRALVLGLGGGSIPRMLRAASPSLELDAVEIDPAVLEVGKAYFGIGDAPGLHVYLEDAAAYVARCDKQYDIVILDAYIGNTIAPQCTTRDFLLGVRRALTSDGVFVVNCMNVHSGPFRPFVSHITWEIGPVWVLHGRKSLNAVVFAPIRAIEQNDLVEKAESLEEWLQFKAGLPAMARHLRLLAG